MSEATIRVRNIKLRVTLSSVKLKSWCRRATYAASPSIIKKEKS
jgi:hypothetical protein